MRFTLLVAAALLVPAAAHASGGMMGAGYGGAGATAPGRPLTYIALPMDRGTLVQAVRRDGGEVLRWTHLKRRYGVPQVGFDGATTGLSADGRVLVLAELPTRYPVRRTRLQFLRATNFRDLGRLSFPGVYRVVAISPHGRYVYLRRSTHRQTRSVLMVYDRGQPGAPRRLSRSTPGLPISQVSDGRWSYTLFGGNDGSWVEGVDTVTQATRRWDVPGLPGNDIVRLRLDGPTLHVGDHTSLTR